MAAEQKELRQLTRSDLLDFLDACALGRNMERAKLINKILLQWAEVEAHKTTVLVRAARDNPLLSESNGSTSGWGDLN
jgi:hypothetical protein